MLDTAMKQQVIQLLENIQNRYTLIVKANSNSKEGKEMLELMNDFVSCSPKLELQKEEAQNLSLEILKNGENSNIVFRAVPTGHEFTTLLLAVLNQEGIGKNLPDDITAKRIKAIDKHVELKSYISLSCTNCPEVVQSLNILSFLNPNIKHQIIDGSINKEEAEALNIQAVPSVYINGDLLHVGRSNMGELITKIEENLGSSFQLDTNEIKKYDVVVAGGGPAGVSAAVYSARKGFSVAVVADKVGGQVTETVDIENMISVPKTTGAVLSSNLHAHLQDYDIDILENRTIENIEINQGIKRLTSSLGEKFETPAVIVATGASWRKLGVEGEEKYIGSGVAFCTHCDGPFYKDKKVVVVGGGNSGLEAAIDLSSIASEVTVVEFLEELKGDQVLQDKLAEKGNVKIITNAATTEIIGNGSKVTALKYKERATNIEHELNVDGVFVQIGLVPNSKVFQEVVETNRMGEIKIDTANRTNIPGIYAAGDVSIVPYKQIVIAMGEGSKAALSAFEDSIKGTQL